MEKIHKFTSEEKLQWWGYGEWIEEPDLILFEHEGFKCVIERMYFVESHFHIFGGYLNGYILIPESHPWHGKDVFKNIDCDVHGGLTYGEFEENNEFWIGFDSAHSNDIVPSFQKLGEHNAVLKEIYHKFPLSSILHPTYKNLSFCIGECKSMAEQANEAQKTKEEKNGLV